MHKNSYLCKQLAIARSDGKRWYVITQKIIHLK